MVGSGVDFSTLVYGPAFDMFARPVTFYPYAVAKAFPQAALAVGAQVAPYAGRGIYDTDELEVATLDGAIYSDQQTILYIREVEFGTLPQQGDRIYIDKADAGPALGEFEITDAHSNGGGETKLILRKWLPPAP